MLLASDVGERDLQAGRWLVSAPSARDRAVEAGSWAELLTHGRLGSDVAEAIVRAIEDAGLVIVEAPASFDDPCTPDACCEAGAACERHAPLHDRRLQVTVSDPVGNTTEVAHVPDDDYLILATGRCSYSVQAYRNGTHVITVKGRVS